MQPEGAADTAFSPMRVARAGRRAGVQAAIPQPDGIGGNSSGSADGSSNTPAQAGPLQQARALRQQESSGHQQPAAAPQGDPSQQQPAQQQQQQGSQPAVQTPPVKRVGFSMDGVVIGAAAAAAEDGRQHNFTGVSRRKQEQLQREEQSQAKHRNKYDEKLVDALVDVPELEEEGKEDITCIVAQAPKATNPQVQAISELELDQAWLPPQPARSTDINLSLLTSCLLPSAQVVEPPDVWDYGMLFSQLKAELQNEMGAAADSSLSGAGNAPEDPVPA